MKVSVLMITYNHQAYIEEAIKGVLMQEVPFEIELIISNDCSTDKTHNSIENCLKFDNKNIIKYHNLDKNLGMSKNFEYVFSQATGEYIAICEGDDYWTDPLKLQKQIDVLETNSEYSFCGHQNFVQDNLLKQKVNLKTGTIEFKDLVYKNFISTASLIYRKSIFKSQYIIWLRNLPAGDWALQLFTLQNTKGCILEDFMSVYRKHDQGVWSNLKKKEMALRGIETLIRVKQNINNKELKKMITKSIKKRRLEFKIQFYDLLFLYLKIKFSK